MREQKVRSIVKMIQEGILTGRGLEVIAGNIHDTFIKGEPAMEPKMRAFSSLRYAPDGMVEKIVEEVNQGWNTLKHMKNNRDMTVAELITLSTDEEDRDILKSSAIMVDKLREFNIDPMK